jgi:cytochrome P450
MRHHGLVQGTQRIFTEDIEVAGQTVPAGTPIVAFLASANRDDAAFPDADRFDITRTRTAKHLAFGRGAHACAGQQLALAQLEVGIEVLFERLPGLALAGEVEWNTTSLVFHGPDRLPVRWDAS